MSYYPYSPYGPYPYGDEITLTRGYVKGQSYQAAFFHIEKTGGTSIKTALASTGKVLYLHGSDISHYRPDSFVLTYGRDAFQKLGTVFTCVRNPYTRLASYYKYCQRSERHPWHQMSMSLSFLDFIKRHKKGIGYQDNFVRGFDGYLLIHRFLKFENLEHDFNDLMAELNVKTTLPRTNSNPRPFYEKLLTPEVKEYIYKRWNNDFTAFGYDRDLSDN